MLRKTVALVALPLLATLSVNAGENSRHFKFNYSFVVKNVAAGDPVQVWIPLAHSDEYQDIRVVSTTGDLPLKKTRGAQDGNTMLYAATKKANKPEYRFAVEYEVVRREHAALGNGAALKTAALGREDRQRFLQPERLVPVTGLPAELAARTVEGKSEPIDKARAIYNYVFDNMKYDKTGSGWGRGDTLYACSAKKGNCTDFHALFMSMTRSQGIPARFEIGFPLPQDKHSSEIAGYHCWSEFYLDSRGWIPVDISEAWKHPDKHDYFFGSHDVNRVQFSVGRDLVLNPRQSGPPLNYFVYPYVEVAGKEHSNVSNAFSFSDMEEAVAAAGNSR